MVVPATIGARPHTDHPARVRHLVVDLTQSRCHLVGKGASNDDEVCLPWRGPKDDAHSVLVVAWSREMHHLDSAASEAEGQGVHGTLSDPVDEVVHVGSGSCNMSRVGRSGW